MASSHSRDEETQQSMVKIKQLDLLKDLMRFLSSEETEPTDDESSQSLAELMKVYNLASHKLDVYQGVSRAKDPSYGFTVVAQRFQHLLRECILTHQWTQALQLVHSLCSEKECAGVTVWKVGLAGLLQDVAHNLTLIEKFVRSLCVLKEVSPSEVFLDYSLLLLAQGHTAHVKDLVQELRRRKLTRFLLKVTAKREHADTLFFAYQGLLMYTEWKTSLRNIEDSDSNWMYSSQDVSARTSKFLADEAKEYLMSVVEKSGVWDIFVTSVVEILEYYDDVEGCRRVLQVYKERNPGNPNAHRYLYQFELKHGGATAEKVESLKAIVNMDPGNPLALDLYEELSSQGDAHSVVVLFDYLDFCHDGGTGREDAGWTHLRKELKKSKEDPVVYEAICQQWESRKDWWLCSKFVDGQCSKTKGRVKALLESLDT